MAEQMPWEMFNSASDDTPPWEDFKSEKAPTADYGNEGYKKGFVSSPKEFPTGAASIPGQEVSDQRAPYQNPDNAFQRFLGSNEALLALGSGMVAPLAGLVGGGLASINQLGRGEIPDFRQNVDSVAQALTYEPRIETAKNLMEGLAPALEGMQALGPTGYLGHTEMARRNALPLKEPVRRVDDAMFKPKPAEPVVQGQQMALPLEGGAAPEAVVRPAEAGAGPARPESRGALANKRQMDIPENGEAPARVDVDTLGEAVRSDANPWDVYARDVQAERTKAQLDADLEAMQRDKLLNAEQLELAPTETQMDLFNDPTVGPYPESGFGPRPEPLSRQEPIQKDGYRIETQVRPDGEVVVRAVDDAGNEIGVMDGSYANEAGHNPFVDVNQEWRRKGVATAMYDAAKQAGALIPEDNGLRTPMGMAFREAYNARASGKQLAADRAARHVVNDVAELGVTLEREPGAIVAMQNGKEVGRLNITGGEMATPEALRSIGEAASVDSVRVDAALRGRGVGRALYQALYNDFDGNIRPSGQTTADAWKVWKRDFPDKVDSFVQDEVARINNGAPADTVIGNITDPAIAQRVSEALPESSKAPLISQGPRGQRARQGGYIRLPFGKGPVGEALGKNERFSKFVEEMNPFKLTPDEYIAKFKNAADMATDRLSHLAASGMYMAQSSKSPLVKYVTDLGRQADSNIKAQTRDFVHNSYAPAWRALKKDEFIDVANVLNEADMRKQEVDLDAMRNRGFSDKAVQVARQHNDLMANLYPKLKEAAEINGMAVPENRTAYAASLMQGDFRRVVRDADGDVVGVIGANTRYGLNRKMKALDGEGYTFGDETYQAGGGRDPMGFQQALQQLAEDNPKVQALIDKMVENMSAETYLGSQNRVKGKKGVFGTTGRDKSKDAYENARDFADAQIRYAENTIKWNEMSKFVADSKKVMEGVDGQPNAKGYLTNFINGELGRSTNDFGKAVDNGLDALGKASGLGTSGGAAAMSAVKKIVNAKLLGLNIKFWTTNLVQPFKVSPEMNQYLAARGMDTTPLLGMDSLAKGFLKMLQDKSGKSLDGITKGAMEYGDKNHVWSSDLFESSNSPRAGFGYYAEKTSNGVAQHVEKLTRQAMFLSLVDQLHGGGVKPKDGLYAVAHKLTDMAMVDYNQKPMLYSDMGSPGQSMSNLMTYKHNELSRMALFARELPRNSSGRALAANLASQVAVAGVMGLAGYAEADWAVRKITEAMGKPMGLTEMMLKGGEDMKMLAYGPLSKYSGIDFSGSLGMEVMPGSLVDAAMPGVSSLGQTAMAVADAAKSPTDFNLRRAGRELLPLGMQGAYDRQMFSRNNAQGQELAISPSQGQVTATRNETDKAVRNFAFTGVNESEQKKLDWELQKTNKFYEDKRKDAVKEMRQAMFTNEGKQRALTGNADFKKAIDKFIKAEGNPDTLQTTVQDLAIDLNLSPRQQQILKDAASSSITNIRRLQRNK